MMPVRHWLVLLTSILACEFAGIIGSLFTASSVRTWYVLLAKPALNPPSWVFAPVWTALYALMGVAVFLVWRASHGRERLQAIAVFVLQLFLNILWSFLFFGLQNPALALGEILLLWCAIVWTIVRFARVSKTAAWLLAPYLLWATFATYLTYSLWVLN